MAAHFGGKMERIVAPLEAGGIPSLGSAETRRESACDLACSSRLNKE
jgi:hypothetical protein